MQKLCEYGIEEQEAEHITLSIFKIKEDHVKHLSRQAINGKLSGDLEQLKKDGPPRGIILEKIIALLREVRPDH